MRHSRRGNHLDRLELRVPDVLEQSLARTEHDRDDVEVELVEQSGRQELANRARPARDRDVILAGGDAGLLERCLRFRRLQN